MVRISHNREQLERQAADLVARGFLLLVASKAKPQAAKAVMSDLVRLAVAAGVDPERLARQALAREQELLREQIAEQAASQPHQWAVEIEQELGTFLGVMRSCLDAVIGGTT